MDLGFRRTCVPRLTFLGSEGGGDPLRGQGNVPAQSFDECGRGRGGRICSPGSVGVGMVSRISDWVIGIESLIKTRALEEEKILAAFEWI